jgi:hypothetical protein
MVAGQFRVSERGERAKHIIVNSVAAEFAEPKSRRDAGSKYTPVLVANQPTERTGYATPLIGGFNPRIGLFSPSILYNHELEFKLLKSTYC